MDGIKDEIRKQVWAKFRRQVKDRIWASEEVWEQVKYHFDEEPWADLARIKGDLIRQNTMVK